MYFSMLDKIFRAWFTKGQVKFLNTYTVGDSIHEDKPVLELTLLPGGLLHFVLYPIGGFYQMNLGECRSGVLAIDNS